jgi:adenylate cyclase
VTIAIAPAIAEAEQQRAMRKPPQNLDAWGAYQRGLWHLGEFNRDSNARAQEFFHRAIDLDPSFAGGYRGLAQAQFQGAAAFQTRGLNVARGPIEELARRAVALDGADAEARACLALSCFMTRGDYAGSIAEAQRALAMSPNLSLPYNVLGLALIFSGRPKDGIAAIQTSISLDPRDPLLAARLGGLASGLYFCRGYEAAIEAATRAIRSYPELPQPYRWLAAALGQAGRIDEAKEALEKAIAVAPASFDMYVRNRAPWFRPEDHEHMLVGLRKAGWEG